MHGSVRSMACSRKESDEEPRGPATVGRIVERNGATGYGRYGRGPITMWLFYSGPHDPPTRSRPLSPGAAVKCLVLKNPPPFENAGFESIGDDGPLIQATVEDIGPRAVADRRRDPEVADVIPSIPFSLIEPLADAPAAAP